MNTRNKLSFVLLALFLVGGTLATLITIKDANQILNDLNNFTGVQPPSWDGNNPSTPLGNINLFLIGNSSVTTSPDLLLLDLGPPQPNIPDIYNIFVQINKVSIKLKDTETFKTILNKAKKVDLMEYNSSLQLLANATVEEGNYSVIKIELSQQIEVISSEGTYYFTLQGQNTVVLSFYSHKGPQGKIDLLTINKNHTSEIYLDINIKLMWQQKIATHVMGAYLSWEY